MIAADRAAEAAREHAPGGDGELHFDSSEYHDDGVREAKRGQVRTTEDIDKEDRSAEPTRKKTDTKIPGAPAPAPHQPPTLQPARKRTRAHTETTEDFESEARRSEPPRKKTDIKNPDAPT